jgi:GT2 family glycosyltransferase
VVVCTRNRGDDLVRALASLVAIGPELAEIVVVDQSTDTDSLEAARSVTDIRIRHLVTDSVGLSRARNIGLASASTDVVLMTDDDCIVGTGWAAAMSAPFADPDVAAVFGDVLEGEHDRSLGFIPHCIVPNERVVDTLWSYDPRIGIGASFGVRRRRAVDVGGFDPVLGAGASLKAGEEHDLAMRLLADGAKVAYTKQSPLVHHGFRTFEQGRSLIRGYLLGTAAAHTKLIRRGVLAASGPFARAAWASIVPVILSSLRDRRVPPVLGRITSLARGTWIGVRWPVDSTDRFVDR